MKPLRILSMLALAIAVGLALGLEAAAQSQEKSIKIGLIYDFSGPFSAAGSLYNYRGAKLAIDWANDRGGILLGKHNYQVVEGKFTIVYPKAFANATPVLPLPASSPFGAR